MMLNSVAIGTYAARGDGFGRNDRVRPGSMSAFAPPLNCSSSSRCTGPPTTPNLATPGSAFSAIPLGNPSSLPMPAASGRAACGSPTSRYDTTEYPIQTFRPSPTSVTATMSFDDVGGLHVPPLTYTDAELSLLADRHFIPTNYAEEELLIPPPDLAVCPPCKPTLAAQVPAKATTRDAVPSKFNSSQPSGARGRRSDRGRNISASDGGERPPLPPSGGGSNNSSQPTPENLRDNPERLAKVKTEMCHYYMEGGAKNCPWGENCNFAHGKHELKFRYTTLCLMEGAGQIVNAKTYLARPCMTWVSTGACPFGRRCAAIHDPSIAAPLENSSWLPVATAKTNAQIIIDRLAAHRESAIHQENPLIAQNIWENCRPSRRGRNNHRFGSGLGPHVEASKSILDIEEDWLDTYALVCNIGVSAFTGGSANMAPPKKVSDLQKLCIVRMMRGGDSMFQEEAGSSGLHRDYIFAPTHSLHRELCMILQARYFVLLDADFISADEVSPEILVEEIAFDEYKSRTTPWSSTGDQCDPSRCIAVHEVAFAPKGAHSSNVSIWFDAVPIKLEHSQIKRSRRLKQKKKTQIHSGHTRPNANGALISRTSPADFPTSSPDIDPFVPMLPAEDCDESHRLIMDIMEHRIDSMILSSCSSVDEEQKKKMFERMKQLQNIFTGIARFHDRWTWPKREGMETITIATKAPPGNIMPYIPSKSNGKSPCLHIWQTFVKTIGMANVHHNHASTNGSAKRLVAFPSIDGSIPRTKQPGKTGIPHIFSNFWWNTTVGNLPNKDDTWKEILFGLPENGKWETALRLHNKKTEGSTDNSINKTRNMSLSMIPFVQN